jgi:pantetheine-phosphate adenylyltransferase
MPKTAVFPGSFDPFTIGHEAIVLKAATLFDKVIVAIGNNSSKTYLFPTPERERWIKALFSKHNKVEVVAFEGLTVDFCKQVGAQFLVRGLRDSADFQFEKSIAQMNKAMQADLETIFLLTDPEFSAINSTILREIMKNGGDVSRFLPKKGN